MTMMEQENSVWNEFLMKMYRWYYTAPLTWPQNKNIVSEMMFSCEMYFEKWFWFMQERDLQIKK